MPLSLDLPQLGHLNTPNRRYGRFSSVTSDLSSTSSSSSSSSSSGTSSTSSKSEICSPESPENYGLSFGMLFTASPYIVAEEKESRGSSSTSSSTSSDSTNLTSIYGGCSSLNLDPSLTPATPISVDSGFYYSSSLHDHHHHVGSDPWIHQPEDSLPKASSAEADAFLHMLASEIKAVTFDFCLRLDRIRISWWDPKHADHQFQLRAYLLLNEQESGDHKHRKQDQQPLIGRPIPAERLVALTSSTLSNELTDICFDGRQVRFRTSVPIVERKRKAPDGRARYVFQSRVVRLKLERVSCEDKDRVIIGFVDLDLAQLRHQHAHVPNPRQDGFIDLPMVLFSDYNRHLLKHQTPTCIPAECNPDALFCFSIRLRLDSRPVTRDTSGDPLLVPLDLWISVENLFGADEDAESLSLMTAATTPDSGVGEFSSPSMTPTPSQTSMHISQLLLRRDSLPNLSKDKELKYHECPPTSRTKHWLNLLGLLPPGQLFRVSIHFGQIDQLLDSDLIQCVASKKHPEGGGFGPICAMFEVKHHAIQPTLFHHHHQRHSITCRTKQLTPVRCSDPETSDSSTTTTTPQQFDQHFTFFERFYYTDSPSTCLSIVDAVRGRRLYKYKCQLADYVHSRSVNQFFALKNKRSGKYCRLQFSIVVKPISPDAALS